MKTLLTILLISGISLDGISQNIDDMSKKELRLAFNKVLISRDSLATSSNEQNLKISLVTEKLIIAIDSIKMLKTNVSLLLNLKNESDRKYQILDVKLNILNDSIVKLKSQIPILLSNFSFQGAEGEFDNGYAENKKLFEEKKYIGYQSTFDMENHDFIIYIDNKMIVLDEKEALIDKLDEDAYTGRYYSNLEYSLQILFTERLDSSPSEDQGEAIYTLIITDVQTGKKTIKKVYCFCIFQ